MPRPAKEGYSIIVGDNGRLLLDYRDNEGRRKKRSISGFYAPATPDARKAARALYDSLTVMTPEPLPFVTSSATPRPGFAGAITVREVLERARKVRKAWKNSPHVAKLDSYEKKLCGYMGDELVEDVTTKRLRLLIEQLEDDGLAPATIRRELQHLSAAFTTATLEEDDDGNPWLEKKPTWPTIEVENFCDRVVSYEEEAAILAAIDQRAINEQSRDWIRFKFLIECLRDTGARLGEVISRKVGDFSYHADEMGDKALYMDIPRYKTKNKKPRSIPLTDELVRQFPYFARLAHNTGVLFPHGAGYYSYMWGQIRDDVTDKTKFDIRTVRRERDCAKGEEPVNVRVRLHTWRHTCLTRLCRSGQMRLEQVSDWAGHSSLNVTRDRYRHMLPQDNLQAVGVLNSIAQRRLLARVA